VRFVAQCFTATDYPRVPALATVQAFQTRWVNFDSWKSSIDLVDFGYKAKPRQENLTLINRSLWRTRIEPRYANHFKHLSDNAIAATFTALQRANFLTAASTDQHLRHAWRPDLAQPAYTLWNTAHRYLLLNLFVNILTTRWADKGAGYEHDFWAFGLPSKFRTGLATFEPSFMGLLIQYYDNFVHSHWRRLAEQDHRKPGAVVQRHTSVNLYKRRIQVWFTIIGYQLQLTLDTEKRRACWMAKG
jgi:hypothetical protein